MAFEFQNINTNRSKTPETQCQGSQSNLMPNIGKNAESKRISISTPAIQWNIRSTNLCLTDSVSEES